MLGGCPPLGSPITLSSVSERRHQPLCWQTKGANPVPPTCWCLACPRDPWLKLYSATFPCWLLSPPISLGVFPKGEPLGPPHRQQRGCPSCFFRLPAWFRNPSPACPIPGFRVKPVLKVLAGIRKPFYLPIEAMPPLRHPNNIQNTGQVSRSATWGTWFLISPPAASSKMPMLGRRTLLNNFSFSSSAFPTALALLGSTWARTLTGVHYRCLCATTLVLLLALPSSLLLPCCSLQGQEGA